MCVSDLDQNSCQKSFLVDGIDQLDEFKATLPQLCTTLPEAAAQYPEILDIEQLDPGSCADMWSFIPKNNGCNIGAHCCLGVTLGCVWTVLEPSTSQASKLTVKQHYIDKRFWFWKIKPRQTISYHGHCEKDDMNLIASWLKKKLWLWHCQSQMLELPTSLWAHQQPWSHFQNMQWRINCDKNKSE